MRTGAQMPANVDVGAADISHNSCRKRVDVHKRRIMKTSIHSGAPLRSIEIIPKEEWVSHQIHQQRLKWAKLGEAMGERMFQRRIENAGEQQLGKCSHR